jgi:hypothetical protein
LRRASELKDYADKDKWLNRRATEYVPATVFTTEDLRSDNCDKNQISNKKNNLMTY